MGSQRAAAWLTLLASIVFTPVAVADWCCRIDFEQFTETEGPGTPQDAALAPDGRHVYQALSGGLRVLSMSAGNGRLRQVELLTTLPATLELPATSLDAHRVVVSPDNQHVYVNHEISTFQYGFAVYRRNTRNGRLQFVQRFGSDTSTRADHVAFAPDGLHLYTTNGNVRAYRRNRLTGELTLLETYPQPAGLRTNGHLAISPDGRNLYLGATRSGDDDGLVIFDRNPLTGLLGSIRSILAGDTGVQGLNNPTAVVFDSSGKDAYISSRSGMVSHYQRDAAGDLSFVDLVSAGGSGTPPRFSGSKTLAMLPGDAMLGLLDDNGLHAIARDPVDGSLRFVESHKSGVGSVGKAIGASAHRLVPAPDRSRLLIASEDGVGSVRDTGVESTREILAAKGSIADGDVASVTGVVEGIQGARTSALSPDGRFLYVGSLGDFTSDPSTLAAFAVDRATGELEQVQFLDGLADLPSIVSIAISPDGKHLYALANEIRNANEDPYIGRLMVFERDRTHGTLTPVQTLVNETDDGAGSLVQGL